MTTGADSLVGVLRYRADELQVNRVLAAISQDPVVAGALVRALLTRAAEVPGTGPRAEKLLSVVPAHLGCVEQERVLAPTGRGRGRQWAKQGDVDLAFADVRRQFHLRVELKIDAPGTISVEDRGQIERYLAAGIPVVAVARRPEALSFNADDDNWLGTITWQALADDLRELPISSGRLRADWLSFLDQLIQDGDFEANRPSITRDVVAAQEWLDGVLPELFEGFTDRLRQASRNGPGKPSFAGALSLYRPKPRGGWVWRAIQAPVDPRRPVWVGVRGFDAPAPAVTVEVYPAATPFGKKKAMNDARRRLADANFYEIRDRWGYRNDEPVSSADVNLRTRGVVLQEAISTRLEVVAASGILLPHVRAFSRS